MPPSSLPPPPDAPREHPPIDSCLQGIYAQSLVTWAEQVCGIRRDGWGGRGGCGGGGGDAGRGGEGNGRDSTLPTHDGGSAAGKQAFERAALVDFWYAHPTPYKNQPPIAPGGRATALIVSCLHMALLHPQARILVLAPFPFQVRSLEQLLITLLQCAGVRPWLRTLSFRPEGGLVAQMANDATILLRAVDGPHDLLRLQGETFHAILILQRSRFLTYEVMNTALLPRLRSSSARIPGWCWLFSE